MNITSLSGFFGRMRHRLRLHARLLDVRRDVASFSSIDDDAIQRIYVINLDRKPDRWRQVNLELGRFRDRFGAPLSTLTRRFSAIDARYLECSPDERIVLPYYSLADQLLVEPNPLLSIDAGSRARRIEMTRPEIAVALSHIDVWRLIAAGDATHSLVLEDDVYFRRGFARSLDAIWSNLVRRSAGETACDLLYLSFEEVGPEASTNKIPTDAVRRPDRGIWQASGYVLSRDGARKVLALLPVHGPIDLWLNLQFGELGVYLAPYPIISQRVDVASTNSYSILPVLSQVGVLTREKPLVARAESLSNPVIAVGKPGSGLTALAAALSIMGYTCCSDLRDLPSDELNALRTKGRERRFNAYVNVGTLDGHEVGRVADLYAGARFIATDLESGATLGSITARNFLHLPPDHPDKWAALSAFFDREYPAFPYPVSTDQGQRRTAEPSVPPLPSVPLRFDKSPWIVRAPEWRGIRVSGRECDVAAQTETLEFSSNAGLDEEHWRLRDDTFPSNLALFSPVNFTLNEHARLTLHKEETPVRSFTSAAMASRRRFRYGAFAAEIRPSNVSGLITGMFLHRNGPRQEIDIEFLGKDTTTMLVNVYFNPGIEGTKLEYGYRGTPVVIELGFDAAKDFHRYEIEWLPHAIRWSVDGALVHERVLWDPTPVPDLAMEFNINLWHSRSTQLAGKLNSPELPAHADIRSVRIVGG